jgi:hypothetical protein
MDISLIRTIFCFACYEILNILNLFLGISTSLQNVEPKNYSCSVFNGHFCKRSGKVCLNFLISIVRIRQPQHLAHTLLSIQTQSQLQPKIGGVTMLTTASN